MTHLPLIEKRYGRMTAKFDRFEFDGRVACFVECSVAVKEPDPR